MRLCVTQAPDGTQFPYPQAPLEYGTLFVSLPGSLGLSSYGAPAPSCATDRWPARSPARPPNAALWPVAATAECTVA